MSKNSLAYERDRQLDRCLPELYSYKTLLYIGVKVRWNYPMFRGQDKFDRAGYKIDVLEINPKTVKRLKQMNKTGHRFRNTFRHPPMFRTIYEGDVRKVKEIVPRIYDVVMWWQGPEHVRLHEVKPTLDALWGKTKHLLVLGCPCSGITDEHPMAIGKSDGNYSMHYSRFDKQFFIDLGFKVDIVGECGKKGNNMLAYKRRPWTPKVRREQLLKAVPDIQSYKSILYIGANVVRQETLDLFRSEQITILEVWPPNVADLLELGYKVIQGDVRELAKMDIGKFDVVIWWHGPEHVEKESLPSILKAIKKIARCVAVVACPWGKYKQSEVRGNPYERHLSCLYPKFFEKLGWKTSVIGEKDVIGSNLLAWIRK